MQFNERGRERERESEKSVKIDYNDLRDYQADETFVNVSKNKIYNFNLMRAKIVFEFEILIDWGIYFSDNPAWVSDTSKYLFQHCYVMHIENNPRNKRFDSFQEIYPNYSEQESKLLILFIIDIHSMSLFHWIPIRLRAIQNSSEMDINIIFFIRHLIKCFRFAIMIKCRREREREGKWTFCELLKFFGNRL